ncbi:MAG: AbrB/MazE/SpoVT family DNA-binding domain-containing protein [Dehalococcoidia bacterium]
MKQSKVSVRGQTVIPQEIRDELGIKPESIVAWSVRDGILIGVPIPEDPIEASIGMLAGLGYTFEDFMADRNAERELERKHEERLLNSMGQPPTSPPPGKQRRTTKRPTVAR